MQILGEQFGIEIVELHESQTGPRLKLLIEDDEHWHEKVVFSAFWLDDLIEVLQVVQRQLR